MIKKKYSRISKIKYIDGIRLRRAILSSIRFIKKHQKYLNKINVFPIPDKDTGTNLFLTLNHIVTEIFECKEQSIGITSSVLAQAALAGAQGYSGTILAHFFSGFSAHIKDMQRLSTVDFSQAIENARKTAYSAVAEPVEGTLLSVIHDWVFHLNKIAQETDDFSELWDRSYSVACESLSQTPKKLEILKKAGVVDAGAQGFVYMLDGISDFIKEGSLKNIISPPFLKKTSVYSNEKKNFEAFRSDLSPKKIGIVTDSSCDLPPEFLKHYKIHMIPLKIIFDTETFLDKVQMSPSQFYKKLVSSPKHPKTSQPASTDVRNIFDGIVQKYDHILSIHLPRVVSGTLGVIETVARKYGQKITCIDGKHISAALGLVIMEAVAATKLGLSREKIVQHIHHSIKNIKIFIVLPTVKYLVKGGRLSKPKGIIGRMLRLNPIISFDKDGRIIMVSKAFGNKNALKKSLKLALNETCLYKKIKFMVAHADAYKKAKWLVSHLSKLFNIKDDIQIVEAAPVLGVHAGPGTVGFGFIGYNNQMKNTKI